MSEILKNRYEIIAIVQAKMCNPNGDPDMSNRPRVDFETNRGIIIEYYLDTLRHFKTFFLNILSFGNIRNILNNK